MKISIIIPVYNEEKSIQEIITKISALSSFDLDKEIIVINDGSTDSTHDKIQSILPTISKYIVHEKNQGKGAAIRSGVYNSTGDIILIQDADLEYSPSDYANLLMPFKNPQVDIVIGIRQMQQISKIYFISPYFIGGRLINFIFNLISDNQIRDIHAGYKLMRKDKWDSLKLSSTGFDFCHEFLLKASINKLTIIEVPIQYKPRSFRDGKKIRVLDGVIALCTLMRIYVCDKFSK